MDDDRMQVYDDGMALTPVMDIAVATARMKQFQEFIRGYLVEDTKGTGDGDYGTIPGTNKPTLYKPGAEKLCEVYGLTDSYQILDKIVDFNSGLFDYELQCQLTSRRTGQLVATGLGSCSSFEGKYRWRDGKRSCPQCSQPTIFASKNDPGFYCWRKKGGCGATFGEDDQSILSQPLGKIENDDFATLKNTILKMAKKRSKIDATLSATRSSGIFSQDIGDDDEGDGQRGKAQTKPQRTEPQRKTAQTVHVHEGAEAYLNELKVAQWVSQEKRGWIMHAVKGFFDGGGSPERINEIVTEAIGVEAPNLAKEEQAAALVKALEDATKLGSGAPKKAAEKPTEKAATPAAPAEKPKAAKKGEPSEPEKQRVKVRELMDALTAKDFPNLFGFVEDLCGFRNPKNIPDEKLGEVIDRLTEELTKL